MKVRLKYSSCTHCNTHMVIYELKCWIIDNQKQSAKHDFFVAKNNNLVYINISHSKAHFKTNIPFKLDFLRNFHIELMQI